MSGPSADGSRDHRVTSGDAVIAVAIEGAIDKPWLILSNSLAADRSMWDGEVGGLANDYRLLRYDTRGHGDSTAPAGPYSFDMLAGDVVALMDHFGIASSSFVGLSLGGMTGLKLALEHPGRISQLVCCDARADVPGAAHPAWDQRCALAREQGMPAIVDDTIQRWVTEETRASSPETVAAIARMIRGTAVEGYAGCIAAIKTAAFAQRLPDLDVPTAYLVGEQDSGAPVEVMREMAALTPGGVLHIVPKAAHLPNLDDPPAFMQALRAALANV